MSLSFGWWKRLLSGARRQPRGRLSATLAAEPLEQRTLLSFAGTPKYVVEGPPAAAAVGDFDQDGVPDLAVTFGGGRNQVGVFGGGGDGTLRPPRYFNAGPNPGSLAARDLDGDGRLDLVLVNRTNPGGVSVLRGEGDGSFGAPVPYTVGASPSALAVGDFDGDGAPDLAVANAGGNSASILANNGDGTFRAVAVYSFVRSPRALVVGDLNGDKLPDLVFLHGATMQAGSVSVLLGNGDGTFRGPGNFTAGLDAVAMALDDFDGDGALDVVVAQTGNFFPVRAARLSLLRGRGDGSFQAPAVVVPSLGHSPNAVASGDFDHDGHADLVVSTGLYRGNGDGTFRPPFAHGGHNNSAAVADLTGDKVLDLVMLSPDAVGVLPGLGDGTFATAPRYAAGRRPQFVAVGDFNKDGAQDLVTANHDSADVSVFFGWGDGTFEPARTHAVARRPYGLAVGDFNNDGAQDLAVAHSEPDVGLWVLLGNGDGSFRQPVIHAMPRLGRELAAGDFNGDGNLDLVVSHYNGLTVLLGNGDGSFRDGQFLFGSDVVDVKVGDVNGDGRLDIANASGREVGVRLGNGDGTFAVARITNLGDLLAVGTLTLADVNADGWLDAVTTHSNNFDDGRVAVLLGTGDGTFSSRRTYVVGAVPRTTAVDDFDGDGHPDLAVANLMGLDVEVLAGHGDGSFQPAAVRYLTGGGPFGLAVGDFDGNGYPDLATSNMNHDHSVAVLLNQRGRSPGRRPFDAAGPDADSLAALHRPDDPYRLWPQASHGVGVTERPGPSSAATAARDRERPASPSALGNHGNGGASTARAKCSRCSLRAGEPAESTLRAQTPQLRAEPENI